MTAIKTDRTHTHELTGETAPVYSAPAAEIAELAEIKLGDGTTAYSGDVAGTWGLFRRLVRRDYGGNEVAHRDHYAHPTRTIPEDLIGWIR